MKRSFLLSIISHLFKNGIHVNTIAKKFKFLLSRSEVFKLHYQFKQNKSVIKYGLKAI